jgi:hypothetical protein
MSRLPNHSVTIEVFGDNNFVVCHKGSVIGPLTWDEMLGAIAEITHPRIGRSRYKARSAHDQTETVKESKL